jgi:ribonuclease T2
MNSLYVVSYTTRMQWPGSFCDTERGCCFPNDVKPAADFGIHGLWPNYAQCDRDDDDGLRRRHGLARAVLGDDALLLAASMVGRQGRCWPQFCDDDNVLSPWEIRDLVASLGRSWPTLSCRNTESFQFWSYEWKKHGTCSNLEQHDYFKRALELKAAHNLTAILADAGIVPSDTETYSLSSVRDAIAQGTGVTANLQCNSNADGEAQLFQVFMCVDKKGKELIDCPLSMPTKCHRDDDEDGDVMVKLPVF